MSLKLMTKQALSVSFKSLKFKRSKFSNPSIPKRQTGPRSWAPVRWTRRLYFGSTRYKPRVYIQRTRDQIQFTSNSSTRRERN